MHGLHARPAAMLAKRARAAEGPVMVSAHSKSADARSVTALMTLGAAHGDELTITARGSNAQAAVDAIVAALEEALRLERDAADAGGAMSGAAMPAERAVPAGVLRPGALGCGHELTGVIAAPGFAVGYVARIARTEMAVAETGKGSAHESRELERAREVVRARLTRVGAAGGATRREIAEAHLAFLDDPVLNEVAGEHIAAGKSAGFAWRAATRSSIAALEQLTDARLRERADDLLDIESHVLMALAGEARPMNLSLPQNAVVVADEMLPSELVSLDRANLKGIALSGGGPTSHVAILAAAMDVPMLAGLGSALREVPTGERAIVDASGGANVAARATANAGATSGPKAGRNTGVAPSANVNPYGGLGPDPGIGPDSGIGPDAGIGPNIDTGPDAGPGPHPGANSGLFIIAPSADAFAKAEQHAATLLAQRTADRRAAQSDCRTRDGTRIEIFANLGSITEAEAAVVAGAEGCGLLRTEFLFIDRDRPPSEEDQLEIYQAIANALGGRPLVLRLMDVGGDKPLHYLPLPPDENPALGLRGVRTALRHPDLLRTQLRAAMRVTPHGIVRILLPMITDAAEVRAIRNFANELQMQLGLRAPVEIGAMIETPAAALTARHIAAAADFLSIGSNDLTQYSLAMDRGHPELARRIDALHPAVLELVALAASAGERAGKLVAVCGGMAADSAAVPFLIGLGVRELSVVPAAVPALKRQVRDLDIRECAALAARALEAESATDVRALVARARNSPGGSR
jgi:phosphocarrier protein FPr